MQLNCPTCGEAINADQINIQEMIAVCGNCHAVFAFNSSAEKAKRRKTKQPDALTLIETDDQLEMVFRTNFRLDTNQDFVATIVGGFAIAMISAIMFNEYRIDDIPLFVPILLSVLSLAMFYFAGLMAYNATHITMTADQILISRKPLPSLVKGATEINLHGITQIKCEETNVSKEQEYDTPRYRVWGETADGARRVIANDLIEDYAFFITQKLEERLLTDLDMPAIRLQDADDQWHNQLVDHDADDQQMRTKY
ncbi:MAG: hypothetical protein ACFE0Q_05075 [Anaerolineae bacterium]